MIIGNCPIKYSLAIHLLYLLTAFTQSADKDVFIISIKDGGASRMLIIRTTFAHILILQETMTMEALCIFSLLCVFFLFPHFIRLLINFLIPLVFSLIFVFFLSRLSIHNPFRKTGVLLPFLKSCPLLYYIRIRLKYVTYLYIRKYIDCIVVKYVVVR